ncbi:MAG: hypothetical protein LM582_08165 [Desulfurococcaceae archaeon]|nr:hypothetical protein [Desulfurococcaceae archaeon]
MELWIIVLSISYGFLMLLDPLIYTYVAYQLNVSSVYLGLCSAMWSIVYIVASMFLGFLADEGKSRTLTILSLVSISLSLVTMSTFNSVTAFISYMLHAFSMASANLALNTAVFDNIDNYYWGKAILFTRVVGNVVRGSMFIALALTNFFNISVVLQITILLLLMSAISIPSISLISERSIYRLYKVARDIGSYVKASTSLLYIDNPSIAQDVFQKIWSRPANTGLNARRIAVIAMFVTCVGDYVLSFLPFIIKNKVNLQTLWIAYGVTALFSIAALYMLREVEFSSKPIAIALILLRSAILILGLNMVNDVVPLTLYLVANSTLFLLIDLVLYNLFVSSSAGYSTSLYYTLRELGSIVGSIIGGYLLSIDLKIYTGAALAISAIQLILAL